MSAHVHTEESEGAAMEGKKRGATQGGVQLLLLARLSGRWPSLRCLAGPSARKQPPQIFFCSVVASVQNCTSLLLC